MMAGRLGQNRAGGTEGGVRQGAADEAFWAQQWKDLDNMSCVFEHPGRGAQQQSQVH